MHRLRTTRLLEYLITIWVVVTINFLLPRAMPGDPFLNLSGESGEVLAMFSQEQRDYYISYYGLDKPVSAQYLNYLGELFKGNLGFSLYYKEPVIEIIWRRVWWTAFLVITAVVLSTLLGVLLGCLSAWWRESRVDKFFFASLITFSEIPAFLLGLVLLLVFAAGLGLFPLSGAMTHFASLDSFMARLLDILHHACLPVLSLTLVRLGGMYLLARNSMITVLAKDYMQTARAKGLPKAQIIFHHALKNALLPIVTRVFLSIGALVGSAILVENVFAYPGLGLLMRESVLMHDYPLIQGIFLVVTLFVLLSNFLADQVYGRLDPRVGESGVPQE